MSLESGSGPKGTLSWCLGILSGIQPDYTGMLSCV